jgi:hypothetical protein
VAAERDETQKGANAKPTWITLGVLLVFTAVYAMVVVGFVHSGGLWSKTYYTVGAQSADRIDIDASLTAVDPVRGMIALRLAYTPSGSYRGPAAVLTKPIIVEVNSTGNGKQSTDAGDRMFDDDFTLGLSGDTAYYPLDKHQADLDMYVSTGAGAQVPARLTMVSSLHDWNVRFTAVNGLPEGDFDVAISVKRSPPVITLAFGIMVVEVMLVLIQVGVVVRAVRFHKVQFTTLAALAALLFAIPVIRNSLPQTPPVGSLSDFLVFFWALMVAGACFIVAAVSWFRDAKSTTEI